MANQIDFSIAVFVPEVDVQDVHRVVNITVDSLVAFCFSKHEYILEIYFNASSYIRYNETNARWWSYWPSILIRTQQI